METSPVNILPHLYASKYLATRSRHFQENSSRFFQSQWIALRDISLTQVSKMQRHQRHGQLSKAKNGCCVSYALQ